MEAASPDSPPFSDFRGANPRSGVHPLFTHFNTLKPSGCSLKHFCRVEQCFRGVCPEQQPHSMLGSRLVRAPGGSGRGLVGGRQCSSHILPPHQQRDKGSTSPPIKMLLHQAAHLARLPPALVQERYQQLRLLLAWPEAGLSTVHLTPSALAERVRCSSGRCCPRWTFPRYLPPGRPYSSTGS